MGAELKAYKVLACDVTKPDELDNLVTELRMMAVTSTFVSIASPSRTKKISAARFFETSRDGYLLAQEVSSYSLVALSRAVAPLMTNGGSIMTLTYLGATRVITNYNVMGVAKAALEASMRYLASELGPRRFGLTLFPRARSRPLRRAR